jgi:glycosyltransferase involved in cell wall biosynthesis
MKMGMIEPHLERVGGIRRIIEVANRLKTMGHDVSIYTPQGKPCNWMPNAVPVFHLFAMYEQKFDIVLFNLAEQYKQCLRTNATKKVFWVLAPEALYKDPEIPLTALQQDFIFFANSNFSVQYIKQRRQIKYNIPIIPGGINSEHFHYNPNAPKDHHLLYYGSARPWKGAQIIEAAIRPIQNLKVLRMEGLNTPQNQMHTLYNRCSCFVSASLVEGFGFTILEAMKCGCPVICTDDGGNRDFVIPNENAIVVPRRPKNIRHAIQMLIGDKALRRKLSKNGLRTANNQKYKWGQVTKKLEKHLLNALDGEFDN